MKLYLQRILRLVGLTLLLIGAVRTRQRGIGLADMQASFKWLIAFAVDRSIDLLSTLKQVL